MNEMLEAIQNNLGAIIGLLGTLGILSGLARMGVNNPIVLMIVAVSLTMLMNFIGFISNSMVVILIFTCFILLLLYMSIIKPGEYENDK